MFSQLMETAEPWFSTFEHDGQKVSVTVQIFSIYLREQMISISRNISLLLLKKTPNLKIYEIRLNGGSKPYC